MAFPKRCVHLDFHTSPLVKVGENFSKENFQAALKAGNLESITVFAKCHHGYCYYPTEVGQMHPGLDFDLLGAQLDAAHEIGVKAPIYITAGWSHKDAVEHPEWRTQLNGKYETSFDFSAGEECVKPEVAWINLCLNDGGYCQHIYELTEEICKRYKKIDGLFYDIVFMVGKCTCSHCVEGMKKLGLDPKNEADQIKYFEDRHGDFMDKCNAILHKYHPNATVFYNSGGADHTRPWRLKYESHYELEDLPTCWGGYDKMPLRAKFFSKTGKDYIGMTGKFHLGWGEFGGYKTKEALKYEIASMSLYGAGASIGDHAHPDGFMEMATYENIGYAYNYLEKITPYVYGGKSTAKVGIYLGAFHDENQGLSNILNENQIDYDIILNNNFEDFKTVIFPSECTLDADGEKALKKYLEKGGKLLFMGNSLVKDNEFIVDCGAKYIGHSNYDCDYIKLDTPEEDIADAFILCNVVSYHAEVTDGTSYAKVLDPYFSRTYGHFFGHKNTPQNKDGKKYDAIVKKGNIVYVASPLCSNYATIGALMHKRIFMYALNLLQPELAFEINLGAQGRITMSKKEDSYVLNMTYASPVKRGCAEIIDDIMPIYNIPVKVNIKEKVKRVYSPVENTDYAFTQNDDSVEFTIDKIHCHNVVVIEY